MKVLVGLLVVWFGLFDWLSALGFDCIYWSLWICGWLYACVLCEYRW